MVFDRREYTLHSQSTNISSPSLTHFTSSLFLFFHSPIPWGSTRICQSSISLNLHVSWSGSSLFLVQIMVFILKNLNFLCFHWTNPPNTATPIWIFFCPLTFFTCFDWFKVMGLLLDVRMRVFSQEVSFISLSLKLSDQVCFCFSLFFFVFFLFWDTLLLVLMFVGYGI